MKKKSAITPDAAQGIIEHHFGKPARSLRRLDGGLNNFVYDAKVGREEFVLRLSDQAEKLQTFMKEQWAVTQARKHGVPTPEILEVGNDVAGLPYMISRKVLGRPGHTCRDRMEGLRALARHAATLNAIRTHDYGHIFDWSPNKLSRRETWNEYLDEDLKVLDRIAIFRRTGVLLPPNLKKLRREVEKMRAWKIRPTLNHGDIRLKNVMLDEKGKIRAILDWEDCTSNVAPFWELSIALHDLTMDEKEAFLDGYGLSLRKYMEMAGAIKALNILNYSGAVASAASRRDTAQLNSLRARLNGTFDLYSL